jgi:hypothetical protein
VERRHEALATARRNFLKSCGKFAVLTPPAVTLMLSAASHNYAVAQSGLGLTRHGNNGFGNGGNDGVPGTSGSNPSPNSGQKSEDEVR